MTTIPLNLNTAAFLEAWAMWQQHRKELRKPLTPLASKLQLDKLSEWGEARAIEAIKHSVMSGFQGCYEPCNRGGVTLRKSGADIVVLGKEYDRVIDRMRTLKGTYGDHQTWEANDISEYNRLKLRRNELRPILGLTA